MIKSNASLMDWAYLIFLSVNSLGLVYSCYGSVYRWLKDTNAINTLAMLLVLTAVVVYFYILFRYVLIVKIERTKGEDKPSDKSLNSPK